MPVTSMRKRTPSNNAGINHPPACPESPAHSRTTDYLAWTDDARHTESVCIVVAVNVSELDKLARSLPETSVQIFEDGRPEYRVRGKLFLLHRTRRKDAIDATTGERLDDVLMIRTPDLDAKEVLLADQTLPFFTTSHFDGWPAVLLRIRDVPVVDDDVLREVVIEAWLAQAPKAIAREWLAAQALGGLDR